MNEADRISSCPMSFDTGFYWDSGDPHNPSNDIPDICRKICTGLWESAIQNEVPEIDLFHDCESSALDYSDQSLQGGTGSNIRTVSVLTDCDEHGEEAFSQSYPFTCPNHVD